MEQIFTKYEIVSLIEKTDMIRRENNVLAYGRPVDNTSTYQIYYSNFVSELEDMLDYEVNIGHLSEKNAVEKFTKLINKLMEIVQPNIKTVYTKITYPLSNPAIIKFDCIVPITYGVLLYLYTYAYQLIYRLEEEMVGNPGLIPGMMNRAESIGPFGIYGHDIDNLVYNGNSTVDIYHDCIICKFSCDS